MKECYYKKGASVIYRYSEYQRVYWNDSGYGYVSKWKRATLVCPPRDAYGRFTNCESEIEFMTLKDEKGRVFNAGIDEVEPDRDICSLSKEELVKLWGEMCKGSIYTSDYRNSQGVFEEVAMGCYDSFLAYIRDEYGTDVSIEEHDTAEEFAYYIGYCA